MKKRTEFIGLAGILILTFVLIHLIWFDDYQKGELFLPPSITELSPNKTGDIGLAAVTLVLCKRPGDVADIRVGDGIDTEQRMYQFLENHNGFIIPQGTVVKIISIYPHVIEVIIMDKGELKGIQGYTDPEYFIKSDRTQEVL